MTEEPAGPKICLNCHGSIPSSNSYCGLCGVRHTLESPLYSADSRERRLIENDIFDRVVAKFTGWLTVGAISTSLGLVVLG